ncbi:MAG: Na-translocating system protein MpsB [Aquificota bacterium]|nr:Na-translocating system protein MpsB [Aquificota bacterium]
MVDFVAVRLVLVRGVLESLKGKIPFSPDYASLMDFLEKEPKRAYLMWEYFSGNGLPELASELPRWFSKPEGFTDRYTLKKAEVTAKNWAVFLKEWVGYVDPELVRLYREFEKREGFIWLEALEETQIRKIVTGISRAGSVRKEDVVADAVFCIDVRSERFRRNLERVGPYRTYGIAGFFGVPMAFVEVSKGHEEFLCPVLIKPRNVVLELPVEGRRGEGVVHIAEKILHDLKANLLTPYITVEAIGLIFGFDFLGKTFFPDTYSVLRSRIGDPKNRTRVLVDRLSEEEIERTVDTVLMNTVRRILERETGKGHIPDQTVREVIDHLIEGKGSPNVPEHILNRLREYYRIDRGYRDILRERLKHIGFSHEEQATLIAKALQSIGLTEGFAPVVLVIGHESKSDNNPYESALDCGACGGSSGLHNARVFCEMANNPIVREILSRRHSIHIPPDTVFVPGVHNTTTDEVTLHDLERIPVKVYPLIERIKDDLKEAGRRTAEERIKELDEKGEPSRIRVYAHDWSQVRPEWGLSGNYAFVIGRRELTQHLDLGGRVFLHSYDYRKDPKGFLLETILSGPLIVAEWINLEHYFSTTDNEVYGSGSKIYHNVVGRFGVVSGNFSDLRTGLPAQTVLTKEGPHHIPIRLIVIVEAPLDFARPVIERVYKVRELLSNRWINMIVFDPEDRVFYRFKKGSWHRYEEVRHGQAQPVRAQEGGDNSQG